MSRYNRLKALKDYGFDINWSDIRSKRVLVAGVGGIGSIAVELLARIGVKTILVMDLDKVEEENLNRLVYTDEHVGMPKVDAMQQVIKRVNPEVEVIGFYQDIMDLNFEDSFEEIISSCDIGLLCLDNIPARQYFNVKFIRKKKPYIDAGLLRSGLGGYVHLVKPFETACYQCTGSVQVTNTNDVSGEPCSASLPTTVNIIASLQVQHLIKYFSNLGQIPDYVGYDFISDENIITKFARDFECYVCGD